MDIKEARKHFPILQDPAYIYFDNAATSQRPSQVINAVKGFYENSNANPLRGLYEWSIKATEAYEDARGRVAAHFGIEDEGELIFVRNATEALNLVAYSYGMDNVGEGDEVVVSIMEHHSNILPWQMVCEKKGAILKYLECDDEGVISDRELEEKITSRTKIVAMGQVSNVLGVSNPVKKAAGLVHAHGGVIVVDGAQGAPHKLTDVKALDADFYAFSGHKMLGPMGIGGLYGRRELLEEMQPFLRGGEMIEYVTRQSATYAELPHKFEAGTVNASDAAGLSAAVDFLDGIGFAAIEEQELKITKILLERMGRMDHVHVYGSSDPAKHSGIVTFNIDGCHPHDIASVLDGEHIAVRAGHHCAQPLMEFMQEKFSMEYRATARASVYFYNTEEEAERFCDVLSKVRGWLGYGA